MREALRRLLRMWNSLGLIALTALAASAFVLSKSPAEAGGWIVVFEDNFDQASLDTSRWHTRFIYNDGTMDHFNKEVQRYRENGNHVLRSGILNLVAKKPWSSGLYPSGMIRSRMTFRYGYFEARIKLPGGRGVFPAFWLNSDYDAEGNLGWPPEIDIMEFAPNGVTEQPNMIHSGVKLGIPNTQGGEWLYRDTNFNQTYKFYRAPTDMTRDWHVYGLLWGTDDTVTAFLDGKRLWQRKYRWVYEDGRQAGPAHILINLAVGGEWAGLGGINTYAFPATLQVDYVRACKLAKYGNGQTRCAGSQYAPYARR
jgi:beta-glucanase (GH16 family)